jgi:hypothetical protein
MFQRISTSLSYLRPRTLARTQKAVDQLTAEARELRSLAKTLVDEHRAVSAKNADWTDVVREHLAAIGEMRQAVSSLALRESQLRAVLEADADLEPHYARLDAVLDEPRIMAHVTEAVRRAQLQRFPFPHIVVENLFPRDFYAALVRGIPPVQLFEDKPVNKQQLTVPFALAPAYGRRVWTYMTDVVAERVISPNLLDKFREPLSEWIAANWPQMSDNPLGPPMELHGSSGRIMLRRRGYNIPPHRDPKWGFITCLIYLPRPGDLETWGTSLYTVEGDEEARGALPHWIDGSQCRLVAEVPFRRNSALIFLNSTGAHGATIPDDAEPADLERYAYQFRVGPTRDAITELMKMLPEERRPVWAGKVTD